MTANTDINAPLTIVQFVIVALFGAGLWFLAVPLIRVLDAAGALQGMGIAIFYAALIPGTVPFIWLARAVARLRRDQIVIGVSVATATASLLDGTALVVMPGLYGAHPAVAGAAILWGVGVGLFLAVAMGRGR